jgi:hypothetical protein
MMGSEEKIKVSSVPVYTKTQAVVAQLYTSAEPFWGQDDGEVCPVGQTQGQTASFRQTAQETRCQSRDEEDLIRGGE